VVFVVTNVLVVAQLLPGQTRVRVILQALTQELNAGEGQFNRRWDFVNSLFHVLLKVLERAASERHKSGQQFVKEAADRPHIGLVIVVLACHYFRRHQEWSSTPSCRQITFLQTPRKPQVRYFAAHGLVLGLEVKVVRKLLHVNLLRKSGIHRYFTKVNHDVFELQVSMHDIMLFNRLKTLEYLFEDQSCL